MAHATPEDVSTYLMRDLTAEELAAASRYLTVVEAIIKRKISDLDNRVGAGEVDRDFLVFVEADIVASTLRNPNRYQYEQAGDYAYSLQRTLGVSDMYSAISPDAWEMLGLDVRGAFTIVPYEYRATRDWSQMPDVWYDVVV